MRPTVFVAAVTVLLAASCSLGLVGADQENDDFDEEVSVEMEEGGEAMEEEDGEYTSPSGPSDPACVYLWEHFDDVAGFERRWRRSAARKASGDEQVAQYDGEWSVEAAREHALRGDLALVLKSKARHAAIAASLDRPFRFRDPSVETLVVQYEVAFQEGQECGGAYLKLLSVPSKSATSQQRVDLASFRDTTPYTIMFGPDKCGNDHKLHFIFRYESPANGSVAERHLTRKSDERLDELFRDKRPHLYRLTLRAEGARYEVSVDGRTLLSGSLLEDFEPPVNPPAEIDDPKDVRPADWDEREMVPDERAVKPADWDEEAPPHVPDVAAVKPAGWLEDEPAEVGAEDARRPDDWDDEMDGEWEAPLVPNPKCAHAPGCGPWSPPLVPNPAYRGGKWRPPLVANPAYRGPWAPRRVPNPHAYVDERPFRRLADLDALGFELWTMSSDLLFDNVLVAACESAADELAAATWRLKRDKRDRDAESLVARLLGAADERPWLWVLYVLAVALPVSLFCYLCCRTQRPAPHSAYDHPQAQHKKTDDEPDQEQEQETVEQEAVEQETVEQEAVEREQEEDGEDEEPPGEGAGDAPAEREQEDGTVASTRRRRVRKE